MEVYLRGFLSPIPEKGTDELHAPAALTQGKIGSLRLDGG